MFYKGYLWKKELLKQKSDEFLSLSENFANKVSKMNF